MPLDDLVSVIETLKARLQTHRQVLQANETRTRMALIDPLLQALGWDPADPALVLAEYDLRGNRADYALLGGTGEPVAFVEAKRLGESLASHRMQIVNYANLSGVPYAGLTDGNQWELYKVFDPAPIEDRLLLNMSIADRPAHEVALHLLLLWQPNLASGQPVVANEPVLTTATEPVTAQPVAEPEIERPPAPPPAPIDDGEPFAAMAAAIIERLPVGTCVQKHGLSADHPRGLAGSPDGKHDAARWSIRQRVQRQGLASAGGPWSRNTKRQASQVPNH